MPFRSEGAISPVDTLTRLFLRALPRALVSTLLQGITSISLCTDELRWSMKSSAGVCYTSAVATQSAMESQRMQTPTQWRAACIPRIPLHFPCMRACTHCLAGVLAPRPPSPPDRPLEHIAPLTPRTACARPASSLEQGKRWYTLGFCMNPVLKRHEQHAPPTPWWGGAPPTPRV